MTTEPQNVQNLDARKLDVDKTDSVAGPSRIDENTRTLKIKGLGLNLQFEWKIKSWMKLER